jgi:hypothetical protein
LKATSIKDDGYHPASSSEARDARPTPPTNLRYWLDVSNLAESRDIPKRHVADHFNLYQPERNAIEAMLHKRRQSILVQDNTVTGFNVGINAGASAGQTVFHVHVHLIPRREGDVADPKGGVRGVIPSKQRY